MSAPAAAVEGGELDFDRAAASATGDVDAGMDDELAEPGVEPIRDRAAPGRFRQARMNPSWTASRASSGSRRISRAAASSRATAAPASCCEGVMIAPLRSLDEVPLVHDDPWSRRGHPLALDGMASPSRELFPGMVRRRRLPAAAADRR